jgi:hypothetical protein
MPRLTRCVTRAALPSTELIMAIRMADAMQLEEYPPYDEPTVPATPETLNQEPATIATPVLTHGVAVNALQQYWHPKCQQIFSKGYKTTPRGKNNKTPQGGAGRTLFVAGKTPLCVGVIEGGSKDSEAASHGWRMSHFDAYFDRQAIKARVAPPPAHFTPQPISLRCVDAWMRCADVGCAASMRGCAGGGALRHGLVSGLDPRLRARCARAGVGARARHRNHQPD